MGSGDDIANGGDEQRENSRLLKDKSEAGNKKTLMEEVMEILYGIDEEEEEEKEEVGVEEEREKKRGELEEGVLGEEVRQERRKSEGKNNYG